MTSWTSSDLTSLRALAALEMNATDIGKQLGRNKNQVIGKCHREGIQLLARKQYHRKPKPPRIRKMRKPYTPRKPQPRPVEAFTLTILELRDGMCKFPSGEDMPPYRYCGAQSIEGRSWCPFHMERVFAPNQPARLPRVPW